MMIVIFFVNGIKNCLVFSSDLNSGMSRPGAATASSNLKCSRGMEKKRRRNHGGANIVIKCFMPSLSFMLQLGAAAPGLFMLNVAAENKTSKSTE